LISLSNSTVVDYMNTIISIASLARKSIKSKL